jgi:hypothetical protein
MGGTTDKGRNTLPYLSENVGGDASVAASPIAMGAWRAALYASG